MVDSIERDTKLNIHQRIHAVMAEAGALEPDSQVNINGKKAYDYISHDAVTKHIQPLFVKHGIMALPGVSSAVTNGNRIELEVVTDFINIDKPDDKISTTTVGQGTDSSDKGPGKALSYAVKSAYLKVLMLNSGDDAGGDETPHDPKDTRKSEVDAAADSVKKAREETATNLKLAIVGCNSLEELKDLKKKSRNTLEAFPEVTADYFAEQFKTREAQLNE